MLNDSDTKRVVVTATRRPNGRHMLLMDGEVVGEAWKKEGPGFSLGLTGFFWRDGKPNQTGGASGTTVRRLKDAVALAERVLTAYRNRGAVTGDETRATCCECGATSDGFKENSA